MSGLFQVTDRIFDEETIHSDIPVMVDFWADWCRPCNAMAPIIEELAQKYKGKVKIVQMNVAENFQTPARFGIRNLPTLMLFKGGEVVHTIVGATPRSILEEELKNLF